VRRLLASRTGQRTHCRRCFWRAFIARSGAGERGCRGCSVDACDVPLSLQAAVSDESYRWRREHGANGALRTNGICKGLRALSGAMAMVLDSNMCAGRTRQSKTPLREEPCPMVHAPSRISNAIDIRIQTPILNINP